MLLVMGVFLLAAALVFFWLSSVQRRKAGIPAGRVVSSDTGAWGRLEKPLYDPLLDLAGRPDYLIEKDGGYIPVEVKSGRTPEAPYDAHIYQLAAYCYLVEKTYSRRPHHGILHYPARDYALDYTSGLESALLEVLAEMRRDEHRTNLRRSHEEPQRCRHCGYRKLCEERLA
jgi:CRISPR-associated exonuclease Cas4